MDIIQVREHTQCWLTAQFSLSFVFLWTFALCDLWAIHRKNICLKLRNDLQIFTIPCGSAKVAWHSLDFAVCIECIASFSTKYHTNDLACLFLPSSSWQVRNTLQWAMPWADDIFTLKIPFFIWLELTKPISMGTRTSLWMLQHNSIANRELHIHIQPKSGDSHFIPKPCKQLPASYTQPAHQFPWWVNFLVL